jgi:glycosyltransferase involved in cell wall biosynthesis
VLVHVVDPSAYTPPYDDALCRALAVAGAQVELHTSHFAHGAIRPPDGYARREDFYRAARLLRGPRARRFAKAIEHVPDMLAYRRRARRADVVHFQWLAVQALDGALLPRRRPLVLTAHDVIPRDELAGRREAQRRLYGRVDAVVAHTEHSRRRLVEELGVAPERVHVIPHGILRPWEGGPPASFPPELSGAAEGPVVLFFGLLRPYKGLDVLLEAWRGVSGAELWIVGMPRMGIEELRSSSSPGVRWLPRFVSDAEMHALMDRASLLVAPYREIEQSGVVFTALGAGLPVLLSDVGGFPELEAGGAAEIVPSGDPDALRAALQSLISDPSRLAAMASCAARAGEGELSWAAIARRTLELYGELSG